MKHLVVLLFAAASLIAADATGKWSGTMTPDGREPGPAHLALTQEGSKLTGTAGPNPGEQHPIQNGKAEGGVLTFEVATGDHVMTFVLKHQGDEIAGDIRRERDGGTQTAKLAVKRVPGNTP